MTDKVTSRENSNIKAVVKLMKDKKYRDENKCFVVEGIRLCNEALTSKISIEKMFYTERAYLKFKSEIDKFINISCKGSHCVSEDVMSYMSDTSSPQGIICVCKYIDKFYNFNKIESSMNVIALENIQNPSNLGTIIRTCDAMGIDTIILTENTCDIYNPKVIRGSMGSIFHVPMIFVDKSEKAISILKSYDFSVYAMILDDDSMPIYSINQLKSRKALFIGNEGSGLLHDTIKKCSGKVTIPMKGKAESLNAAVATSIAIWEITGRGTYVKNG